MLIEVAFSGKVRVFWIIFFAKGWSALYAIEMRKLEEELEVEVKVSVGCDPDERIDDDVEPCEVDPEELRHYVALKRQYHYLGFDDLCKISGFSGVLRRTRLRSPRGLVESSERKKVLPAVTAAEQAGDMMIGNATGVITWSLPNGRSFLNAGCSALVQYRTDIVQMMVVEMDGY